MQGNEIMKIIHKARWKVIEGYFICPNTIRSHTLCKNMSGLKMSPQWARVTCKVCLKMRREDIK